LTPQIAKRAYELYGKRAPDEGTAVQDWEKAEREIRKDEPKAGAKPEALGEPKPEAKEPKTEAKAQPEPEVKAEPKPEAKAESKLEAKTPSDLTPQIVKRVHELYEELGREDVREVEEWEKTERETRKDRTGHKDVA
jgi:hypothetical protein